MARKEPVTPESLHAFAASNIFEVLSGKQEFSDKTSLAMKYLNYENRSDGLRYGKAKLAFAMVKTLADPEIVRKYIATTEPTIKKLTGARKPDATN
jgi:hypothetical protein